MDLSNLNVVTAASDARPMPLVHPHTQEETPVVLLVLGYDSDVVSKTSREFNSALMKKRRKMQPDELFSARRVALAKSAVVGLAEGSDPLQVNEVVLNQALTGDYDLKDGDPKKLVTIKVPSREFSALLDHKGFSFISTQVEKFGDDRGNYSTEAHKD